MDAATVKEELMDRGSTARPRHVRRRPRVGRPRHLEEVRLRSALVADAVEEWRQVARAFVGDASVAASPGQLDTVLDALHESVRREPVPDAQRWERRLRKRRERARQWRGTSGASAGVSGNVRWYASLQRALLISAAVKLYRHLTAERVLGRQLSEAAEAGALQHWVRRGIRVSDEAFSLPRLRVASGDSAFVVAVEALLQVQEQWKAPETTLIHIPSWRALEVVRRLWQRTSRDRLRLGDAATTSLRIASSSVATLLYEATAYASHDILSPEDREAAYRDLGVLVTLAGRLPGLGMLPRLAAVTVWELLFLLAMSTCPAWDATMRLDEGVASADAIPLAHLFYERLLRPAHCVRRAENEPPRASPGATLSLGTHAESLARQCIQAATLGDGGTTARQQLVATGALQLLYEVNRYATARERSEARQRWVVGGIEAAGGDARFVDAGQLVLNAYSADNPHDLPWLAYLGDGCADLLAIHAYTEVLSTRAPRWSPAQRHSWVFLFLVHHVALGAGDKQPILRRLDPDTRRLVVQYRRAVDTLREAGIRHPFLATWRSAARPSDSIADGATEVDVSAGDLASAILLHLDQWEPTTA